jgi:hypothetical protein
MSTKATPQAQLMQQQMHMQQQMLLSSLQMFLNAYKDLSPEDSLKPKLQSVISELLQPFLPASKVITE